MKAKSSFMYLRIAALLLSLHYAFTVYINSTFLSKFFTTEKITSLYSYGAIGTIILLAASCTIIRHWGNFRWFVTGLILEIITLYGIATSHDPAWIASFFVLHQMLPPLLLFSLDIFVEKAVRTENVTGWVRSVHLTIINIAFLMSPFVVTRIADRYSLNAIYLISAAFLAFLLFIAIDHLRIRETHLFREASFWDSVRKFSFHPGLWTAFFLNFLLHCFYAVMIIYMPIYLQTTMGFSLTDIGLLFTIMLIPFVIFELPLGRLFDSAHAERDTLIVGYLIIGATLIAIFHTTTQAFWMWAVLLFLSRTGASFVGVASEYLFFKKVDARDVGFISVFRMTSPLAYFIAPVVASAIVAAFSTEYLFISLGALMFLGIPVSYSLHRIRKNAQPRHLPTHSR